MNREIKFRGKSVNGWVYGYYAVIQDKFGIATPVIYENPYLTAIPVEENTVGQYTGLKDKNEVEIYEGDVVNISSHTPFYNVVNFDEKGTAFQLCPIDKRWSKSYFTNYENADKERFEVIGNIYENEDLLQN